jgi:glucose uptake protein GlcU
MMYEHWAHWSPHGRLMVGVLSIVWLFIGISLTCYARRVAEVVTGSELHNRIMGPVALATGTLIAIFDLHG